MFYSSRRRHTRFDCDWSSDVFFFFSSRRRHTRFDCDWISDVCSSDLAKLTDAQKSWVLDGSPNWNGKWTQTWYGIKRFFEYLESKAYKMHIRVLLSKYRSYTECPTCGGARLKTESLLWRLGGKQAADAVLPPGDEGRYRRFMPKGVAWSREQLDALPGL